MCKTSVGVCLSRSGFLRLYIYKPILAAIFRTAAHSIIPHALHRDWACTLEDISTVSCSIDSPSNLSFEEASNQKTAKDLPNKESQNAMRLMWSEWSACSLDMFSWLVPSASRPRLSSLRPDRIRSSPVIPPLEEAAGPVDWSSQHPSLALDTNGQVISACTSAFVVFLWTTFYNLLYLLSSWFGLNGAAEESGSRSSTATRSVPGYVSESRLCSKQWTYFEHFVPTLSHIVSGPKCSEACSEKAEWFGMNCPCWDCSIWSYVPCDLVRDYKIASLEHILVQMQRPSSRSLICRRIVTVTAALHCMHSLPICWKFKSIGV